MTRAVVLLSGGLDSATTLAMARHDGLICHALSLDYGQRHRAELEAAGNLARSQGAAEHRVMRLDMGPFGGSALTDSTIAVPESASEGIPVTYVPARNTIMLSLALGWAEVLDADAFEAFKEKGLFDAATARSFRDNILSRGGSADPMELYVKFRGRQPKVEAVLKRRGLQ